MVRVHPTALVEPGAELDEGVEIGPFCLVGPEVRIGRETRLDGFVVLESRVELGAGCRIGHHALIGAAPQDLKYRGEPTGVVIGDGTTVREYASIHRASTGGQGITRVGPGCFLMAYVHVAHDCRLGERVIMANAASLAGHVEIGAHVMIGGMTGIHQFVRVGEHAFVGACSAVLQDVPPYVKVQGNLAKPYGLNLVGLRRHGLPHATIHALQHAYRLVFSPGLNTSQALAQLEAEGEPIPEVRRLLDFIRESARGVSK